MKMEIHRPRDINNCEAAVFFRCGQGACLMIPYHRNYDKEEPYDSDMWLSHRQLMTDLVRGFLHYVGKHETAEQCLADPAIGSNSYHHAVSTDGKTEVWLLTQTAFSGPMDPIPLRGVDVLTGVENPSLTKEYPCAVIRRDGRDEG